MSRNNVQKTLQLLLQVGRLLRGIQKLAKNVLDWIILLLEVINFESYFLVIVDVRQKKKKKADSAAKPPCKIFSIDGQEKTPINKIT